MSRGWWGVPSIVCNDYFCEDEKGSDSQPFWQRNLDDSTPINHISLPGTHDTMADEGKPFAYAPCWTLTQSLTLTSQLKAGVRVLDIRITPYPYNAKSNEVTDLRIHHGKYHLQTDFHEVLDECTSFLRENPTEFIVMRIKPEYKTDYTDNNWEDFVENDVNRYDAKYFYDKTIDDGMPNVIDVRGKVVLLQQEMGDSIRTGFFNFWTSNDIQDTQTKNMNTKKYDIEAQLEDANTASSSKDEFYINFISGTGIRRCAKDVAEHYTNEFTYDWIQDNNPVFVGIIMMDFPGQGLIDKIIALNPVYESTNDVIPALNCATSSYWSEYKKNAKQILGTSYNAYFRGFASDYDTKEKDRIFNIHFCQTRSDVPSSGVTTTLDRTTRREDFEKECGANAAIIGIENYYAGYPKYDRNWDFICRALPSGYYLASCAWSSFANNYKKDFNYDCPDEQVITGVKTTCDMDERDRIFKFKCCTVMKRIPAKVGLSILDHSDGKSGDSGSYSSLFAEYIVYIIIGLSAVNCICFVIYCYSKRCGNRSHKYESVSLDSSTDIENK